MLAAWAIGAVARRWRLDSWWAVALRHRAGPCPFEVTTLPTPACRPTPIVLARGGGGLSREPAGQREMGSAFLAKGQPTDAEQHLQRSLALPFAETSRAMAYSQLGIVYRRQNRFSDAASAFGFSLSNRAASEVGL